jgi:hypothetical protein
MKKHDPITASALRWWLCKTVAAADKWTLDRFGIESIKATKEQIVELYQAYQESNAIQTNHN